MEMGKKKFKSGMGRKTKKNKLIYLLKLVSYLNVLTGDYEWYKITLICHEDTNIHIYTNLCLRFSLGKKSTQMSQDNLWRSCWSMALSKWQIENGIFNGGFTLKTKGLWNWNWFPPQPCNCRSVTYLVLSSSHLTHLAKVE